MKLIIISLSLFLITNILLAQKNCQYTRVDGIKKFSKRIDSLKSPNDPGFALLVGTSDKILFQSVSGLKNIGSEEEITIETPFYIASIGKTFTAFAILKLKEDKRLKLSDKLSKYFPDFPNFANEITIYNLLNHTSGIPDYFDYSDIIKIRTNSDVINFVKGMDSLNFKPGSNYAYSNTAYNLLAEIIKKQSGLEYHTYIENQFLKPLKMNHTYVVIENQTIPNRAVGYSKSDGKWVKNDYDRLTVGSGGIYSTVGDLYKWYQAIIQNNIVSKSSVQLAWHAPYTTNGNRSYMGMGWFEETFGRKTPEVEGLEVKGAIGVLKGFRSNLSIYPNHDLVFIILNNTGDFYVDNRMVAQEFFIKNNMK